MAIDPVTAIASAFDTLVKFIQSFFKTAKEKVDQANAKETERLSRIRKRAREYFKRRLNR